MKVRQLIIFAALTLPFFLSSCSTKPVEKGYKRLVHSNIKKLREIAKDPSLSAEMSIEINDSLEEYQTQLGGISLKRDRIPANKLNNELLEIFISQEIFVERISSSVRFKGDIERIDEEIASILLSHEADSQDSLKQDSLEKEALTYVNLSKFLEREDVEKRLNLLRAVQEFAGKSEK